MHNLLDQLWEPDKANSYARLTITLIKGANKGYYQWHEEVQIRPYPNPSGYGGQWGSGTAYSEAEIERLELSALPSGMARAWLGED